MDQRKGRELWQMCRPPIVLRRDPQMIRDFLIRVGAEAKSLRDVLVIQGRGVLTIIIQPLDSKGTVLGRGEEDKGVYWRRRGAFVSLRWIGY